MRKIGLILLVIVAAVACRTRATTTEQQSARAVAHYTLPRSTPAQEGVEPGAVGDFVEALMAVPQTDIHHLMIVRHGKVIAEVHPAPFGRDDVHTLYSCSKTFTMLAIGMLIDDGKLSLNDRVVDLFPDKLPRVQSAALKAMTVRHLLIMGAGIRPSLELRDESDDWARTWLAKPVTALGKFQYDSMCTFMLSAIVQRKTGKTLLEFLNERFFHPLGITEADWEMSPDGVCTGGWGLRLTAESMAKAGVCIMNKGAWQGRQLVSAKWIDEASRKHNNYSKPGKKPTDTNQGYCYQMWRCLQPDAFRADGAYGQFIVMSPKNDLVVVMTGVSWRTGEELATIWNKLMPGVKGEALSVSDAEQHALESRLARVALPLPQGEMTGKWQSIELAPAANARHYRTMKIDLDGKGSCRLTLVHDDEAQQQYTLAHGSWHRQLTTQAPPYNNAVKPVNLKEIPGLKGDYAVAGTYAWTGPDTLTLKLYFVNWIVPQTFTITFAANGEATIVNDEGYPPYPPTDPESFKATIVTAK